MARPSRSEDTMYARLAEKMVRENKNIRQAAMELHMNYGTDELVALECRKGFQRVLWTERNKFYKDLAMDPERDKIALIGQMEMNVQKLQADGMHKDAIEGLLKIAKVKGYVSADQQVNIFGNVTPKELEEAKRIIGERLKPGPRVHSAGFTQEPGEA